MSDENSAQCPVCGSVDVAITYESRSYSAPFSVPSALRIEVATCRTSGESGDFRNANVAAMKQAIETADQKSIAPILEWLGAYGVSMAFIERALRLPTRTVARWKSGECSASGIALLRLLRTYPWLLDVAASGFSDLVARRALLTASSAVVAEAVDPAGPPYSVSASQSETGTVELRARFESKKPMISTAPAGVSNSVELLSLAA